MQSDDALVWVQDSGIQYWNLVISNAFDCHDSEIRTDDMSGVFLEPGIYRLIRVEKA